MSVAAVIENGKVVDTKASTISDSTEKKSSNSSLDKEAFLQLLVAQMQYQDPLQPMENTEYVSQLATFSELEAMNNLNDSMSFSRASELVGKNVLMRTTSQATGETYMTQGIVDYVVYENGRAYLAIDESLYSLDDLDTIISDEYWDEYQNKSESKTDITNVTKVVSQIAALPDSSVVKTSDEEKIKAAREAYEKLSEKDKAIVPNDALYYLIKAEAALTKLNAGNGSANTESNTETGTNEGETPEA